MAKSLANNGEKREALKIHAGADEKHDITKANTFLRRAIHTTSGIARRN